MTGNLPPKGGSDRFRSPFWLCLLSYPAEQCPGTAVPRAPAGTFVPRRASHCGHTTSRRQYHATLVGTRRRRTLVARTRRNPHRFRLTSRRAVAQSLRNHVVVHAVIREPQRWFYLARGGPNHHAHVGRGSAVVAFGNPSLRRRFRSREPGGRFLLGDGRMGHPTPALLFGGGSVGSGGRLPHRRPLPQFRRRVALGHSAGLGVWTGVSQVPRARRWRGDPAVPLHLEDFLCGRCRRRLSLGS